MQLIDIFNVNGHIVELLAHQSNLLGKGGIGKNDCELGLQAVLKNHVQSRANSQTRCSDTQFHQGIEGSFISS